MKKILVTGFEPFLGSPVNPSRRLVEELSASSGHGEWFETLLLPVSFDKSIRDVNAALRAKPEVAGVLMFGQAGGRSKVSLERVALNWCESTAADEDGARPGLGPLNERAAPALFSTLPLDEWRERLTRETGTATEVSLSAGGFVCNSLYFDQLSRGRPALFVHVPYLPEQAAPGEPSMTLPEMVRAGELLLRLFHDSLA